MKTRGHLIAALVLTACGSDPGTVPESAPEADEPSALVVEARPLPAQAPVRTAHDTDNSDVPAGYDETHYHSVCGWFVFHDVGECDCDEKGAVCGDYGEHGPGGACIVHAFCVPGGLTEAKTGPYGGPGGDRRYVCTDGRCQGR